MLIIMSQFIISGCRSGNLYASEIQPMFFSPVHGENIHISRNGTMAQRSGSFCKGIVFSGRPVKVNEKVRCPTLHSLTPSQSVSL